MSEKMICGVCRRESWSATKARALLKEHAVDALDMLCSGNDGSNAKAMLDCYRFGYERLRAALHEIATDCRTCDGTGKEIVSGFNSACPDCRTAREALGMKP